MALDKNRDVYHAELETIRRALPPPPARGLEVGVGSGRFAVPLGIAGLHSGKQKLFAKGFGLIDVFILTAAKSSGARVWTLDKKMASLLAENTTARLA